MDTIICTVPIVDITLNVERKNMTYGMIKLQIFEFLYKEDRAIDSDKRTDMVGCLGLLLSACGASRCHFGGGWVVFE